MANTVFLEGWHKGQLVVRATQSQGQAIVFTKADGTPFRGAKTIDRLILRTPDGESFVIDTIPGPEQPNTDEDSCVSVRNPGSELFFRANVRCLIATFFDGSPNGTQYATIKATLKMNQNNPILGSFKFGKANSVNQDFNNQLKNATSEHDSTVRNSIEAALTQRIGLHLKEARISKPIMKFAPIPSDAEEDNGFREPKDPKAYTIHFTRVFRLERREHELKVQQINVTLSETDLVKTTLINDNGWDSQKFRLTQTGLCRDEAGHWVVTLPGFPATAIRDAWNASVSDPYHESLQTVSDGRPVSFLPEWTYANPADPWLLTLEAKDLTKGISDEIEENEVDVGTGAEINSPKLIVTLRSVQPLFTADSPTRTPDQRLDVSFRSIRCHDGQALNSLWKVRHVAEGASGNPDVRLSITESVRHGFVFQASVLRREPPDPNNPPPPRLVRFGALDLEFPNPLGTGTLSEEDSDPRPRTQVRVPFRLTRDFRRPYLPSPNLRVRMRALRALPGGQDSLPGDATRTGSQFLPSSLEDPFRRAEPILIPADVRTGSDNWPSYRLEAEESAGKDRSQRLAVRLFEAEGRLPGATKPRRLVVLDTQPLLVAAVMAPPLVRSDAIDSSGEVGNWSSDGFEGASWELIGGTNGFTLTLPPQAIGEAMEKRRGSDAEPNKAVPFRLGMAARFHLESSYWRQNFVEATWNLRRILGYVGQRAPGARCLEARFELLYGLAARIANVPALRLAEMESRIGEIPRDLPPQIRQVFDEREAVPGDQAVFDRYRAEWIRQFTAYRSRLGVLEPWSEGLGTPLHLRAGVSYALRNLDVAPQADPTNDQDTRFPGGALWGIDSPSAYRGLLDPRWRASTSGEISRPAFSALGGWGYQKAVFQNGLTTIYSNTAQGRVFFYSIERIGRIAGCYNKCKHVTIFERTVAPTPDPITIREQDHHPGRPIIRKVAEYVEFLETTRPYPDFGHAPVHAGCVQAAEFPTRINVNSTWRLDINVGDPETEGYVIPLWQSGTDPVIFPRPQITIRLAAVTGGDAPAELVYPEKLFFYSRAKPKAVGKPEDTDDWDAVKGYDYPDMQWPSPPPPLPAPGDNLETPLPDGPAVYAGYERFTHQVRATAPVNVVAVRSDTPVAVRLDSVSFVRGSPVNESKLSPDAQTVRSRLDPFLEDRVRLAGDLRSVLERGLDGRAMIQRGEWNAIQAQLTGRVNDFKTIAQGMTALDTVLGGNRIPLRDWRSEIESGLNRWRNRVSDFIDNELAHGLAEELAGQTDPNRMVKMAERLIRHRMERFLVEVRGPGTALSELLSRTAQAFEATSAAAKSLSSDVSGLRDDFNRWVASLGLNDISAANEFVEAHRGRARQLVADLFNRLISRLATAARLVVASLETVFDTDALQGDFTTAIDTLNSQRNSILSRIFDRLISANEFQSDIHSVPENLIDNPLAKIGALRDQLLDGVGIGLLDQWLHHDGTSPSLADRFVNAVHPAGNPWEVIKHLKIQAASELTILQGLVNERINESRSLVAQLSRQNATGIILRSNLDLGEAVRIAEQLEFTFNEGTIFSGFQQSRGVDELRHQVDREVGRALDSIDSYTARIHEAISRRVTGNLYQAPDNVMRIVRIYGDSPATMGMTFNKQKIGYYFNPKRQSAEGFPPVDITPVVALVNRGVDSHLRALGICFPSGQLLDRVLPPPDELMRQFDFGKLLPDFAGIKLDKLLPDLKAPASLKDRVKITQQLDRQTGRGWVQCDVNVAEPGPNTLLAAGPLKVVLTNILFTATMRFEAGLNGTTRHTHRGRLSADWALEVSGRPLVTFTDTALTFDESGRTRLDLKPEKIKLDGILAMLSDVLKLAISDPDSGLTLRLANDNAGRPIGVEAILELPVPDLAFGPSSISDLRFGANLGLLVNAGNFEIMVGAHLGRKTAPFTIIVFILGGGGWLDVRSRYIPNTGQIQASISLGLSAGAMLKVSFGPAKGCVYAFLFIEGELQTNSLPNNRDNQRLIVRGGLLLGGCVDVCGIVTVSIQLLLELEYNPPVLVGRGILSVRVKICWFTTISFSVSVEKRLSAVGGAPIAFAGNAGDQAKKHLSMLV